MTGPDGRSGSRSWGNKIGRLAVRPTSKDQCKHNGWKTYGVFKNQGDCIGFVVRQATKECVFERTAIGRRAFREKHGGGRFDLFAMPRCVQLRAGG